MSASEWQAAMALQKLTPTQLEMRRRRRERREQRRSQFIGQPCTSAYGGKGDKAFEDCEDWCLETKVSHCRYCKCRGCKHCHDNLALPEWVYNTPAEMQCASFGICLNTTTYPLCLSVWRGEAFDGAPLVWSRCRPNATGHQQRWTLSPDSEGSVVASRTLFRIELVPTRAALTGEQQEQPTRPLCVAAPMAWRRPHGYGSAQRLRQPPL